jgi:hypothetical protein
VKRHHYKCHQRLCCCPHALWPPTPNLGDQHLHQSKENLHWLYQMISQFCLQRKQHRMYKSLMTVIWKEKKIIGYQQGIWRLFWPPWEHCSSLGKAFSNGFWRRPVPGKTNMLIDFTSCFSESSSGLNPNFDVQVSTSSVIAGMINFSTLRELRIWNGKQGAITKHHQKSATKQEIRSVNLTYYGHHQCKVYRHFWKYNAPSRFNHVRHALVQQYKDCTNQKRHT